ncbi:MAG: GNAT family N-acetyltransferase [Clostridia bacterium]|nr:GNAT family N-acetyltransferase [Clostridia bacterium]
MIFFRSNLFYLPQLETERLILRRIRMSDADDIFAYSKDPEVARYVLWDAQTDIREARQYCRSMIRQYRLDEPSSWGIIERFSGHLIGTIGYMSFDEHNHSTEVGYSLAHWKWNQGIMTEALGEVIQYTFSSMDINRIEAQHETENPASGRVMEKCGMHKEGILRQRLYNKGRYVDVSLYSILKSDLNRSSESARNQ